MSVSEGFALPLSATQREIAEEPVEHGEPGLQDWRYMRDRWTGRSGVVRGGALRTTWEETLSGRDNRSRSHGDDGIGG